MKKFIFVIAMIMTAASTFAAGEVETECTQMISDSRNSVNVDAGTDARPDVRPDVRPEAGQGQTR